MDIAALPYYRVCMIYPLGALADDDDGKDRALLAQTAFAGELSCVSIGALNPFDL